jgi:hypothetical protein
VADTCKPGLPAFRANAVLEDEVTALDPDSDAVSE